jgi:hypothetical protein
MSRRNSNLKHYGFPCVRSIETSNKPKNCHSSQGRKGVNHWGIVYFIVRKVRTPDCNVSAHKRKYKTRRSHSKRFQVIDSSRNSLLRFRITLLLQRECNITFECAVATKSSDKAIERRSSGGEGRAATEALIGSSGATTE